MRLNRARRAASNSTVTCGAWLRTRQILADVPPMSNERRFRCRRGRDSTEAAWAPAAGPDSSIRIGNRAAVSGLIVPPRELTTVNAPRWPAARSRSFSPPR